MLDTTAADHLIAYLARFAADGKAVAMFEHRREYLDGVSGLRLLTLEGSPRTDDFLQQGMALPWRASFNLEMEGLSVHLGRRAVLQNLSLSLRSGQIVAVVGRNGVGKTTLLRVLSGLQRYSGKVIVTSGEGDQEANFGMVFQNPDLQLFNASVREEILYRVQEPDLAYYQWLLDALGLSRYEKTPPLLLSEGEKKRVALGLVLMRRPSHGLLLDEPSLGQDSAHKTILVRMLRTLADAGQLVIMTTHDLTLASQADRLILLGPGGDIVANGLTDAVLRDQAAWQKIGIALPAWFLRSRHEESTR
jgi:energy-coupling factor transport system ATP-binding protein